MFDENRDEKRNLLNYKDFLLNEKNDNVKIWVHHCQDLLDHTLGLLPQEIDALDWKQDISPNKERLKEHLSAFANLPGGGYLVFGVSEPSGVVSGVTPDQARIIVDRLTNLAREALEPPIQIDHSPLEYQGAALQLVQIKESPIKPVGIRGRGLEEAYVRSGGSTRKATRQEIAGLMLNSHTPRWEDLRAGPLRTKEEALSLLDFENVAKLLGKPRPVDADSAIEWLLGLRFIERYNGQGFYITHLGAISAARNLEDFPDLARKAVRIIQYQGTSKTSGSKELPTRSRGYAVDFEDLIAFISAVLPAPDSYPGGIRKNIPLYPEIALRELIANALIHQDFSVSGASPIIAIYSDRIEITNPGALLPSKSIRRLIGTTPESRNERLAKQFRQFGLCEEQGSGLLKTLTAIEDAGLPPLILQSTDNSFRAILQSPRDFSRMSPQEKLEACYQHAVRLWFESQSLTNASLRERLRLSNRHRSQISTLIREATAAGLLKPRDPENRSLKYAEYVPAWA